MVAQVKQPILGADFLSAYDLLVNMNKKKLIDKNTLLQVNGTINTNYEPHIAQSIKPVNKISTGILSKYESSQELIIKTNAPYIIYNTT